MQGLAPKLAALSIQAGESFSWLQLADNWPYSLVQGPSVGSPSKG